MRNSDFMTNVVTYGGHKISEAGTGGVIVCILDADDDCPAEIGPEILHIIEAARPDIPASVVVAKHEYENWLIASAKSLRNHKRIRDTAESPDDPEQIGDVKGFLARRLMVEGAFYSPTVDQPALTTYLDFDLARTCDSFDKLYRDLTRILGPFVPEA